MPVQSDALRMRSGLRPKKTWRRPSPSTPSRRSAGTSTSSKNSWNCFSGRLISTGMSVRSSPGASVSTTKSDSWPRPVSGSTPVRATTSIARCLVDAGDVGLGPAQSVDVAVTRRRGREVVAVRAGVGFGDGEHHLLAAAETREPARLLRVGAEPGERARPRSRPRRAASNSGQPCAAGSSLTTTSSLKPPPPPPNSSGRCTERKPGSASACHSSSARRRCARAPGTSRDRTRRRAGHRLAQHHVLGGLGELHRALRQPVAAWSNRSIGTRASWHTSTEPGLDRARFKRYY